MLNHKFCVEWDNYSLCFDGRELTEVMHIPYSASSEFGDDWFIDISGEKVYIYFDERYARNGYSEHVKLIDISIGNTKVYTLEAVDSPMGVYYICSED